MKTPLQTKSREMEHLLFVVCIEIRGALLPDSGISHTPMMEHIFSGWVANISKYLR